MRGVKNLGARFITQQENSKFELMRDSARKLRTCSQSFVEWHFPLNEQQYDFEPRPNFSVRLFHRNLIVDDARISLTKLLLTYSPINQDICQGYRSVLDRAEGCKPIKKCHFKRRLYMYKQVQLSFDTVYILITYSLSQRRPR